MTEYNREIAKIKSTHLGYESHGILTIYMQVSFGGLETNVGGYFLGESNGPAMAKFIAGVLVATGVDQWERVVGRTVFLLEDPAERRKYVGMEPLPTEQGKRFLFADAFPPKE